MTTITNRTLTTTGEGGLNHAIPPMRLYHKAKELGVWNPQHIDFSGDQKDWQALSDTERDVIIRLTSLFQAGEESVTLDLLPLIMTIAKEGRIEEEMFLTTFLWEEAKHTEFFRRFIDEVTGVTIDLTPYHSDSYKHIIYEELPASLHALTGVTIDLTPYHSDSYKHIIYEELPASLHALTTDPSPANQVKASVTYNMIVEGVMAETGYHGYYAMLDRNKILPGLKEGIGLLKRDESRHIAYGVYLLSRLVASDPSLWEIIEERMNTLFEPALNIVNELFAPYDPMPFDLQIDEFLSFAMNQFQKRMSRIEKARKQTIDEINKMDM